MKNSREYLLNNNSFIVIESAILLNQNLTPNDKILYGYIVAFSQAYGFCTMRNSKLCKLMNIKKRQLCYCLAKLKKYNYITIKLKGSTRFITPVINKFIDQREKENKKIDLIDYDWLNDPDF